MAQIVGERVSKGDAIVDYEDKVFEDIQAEPGEQAFILMHTASTGRVSTPTWCSTVPVR